MKKVTLKELTLRNFKKAHLLQVPFSQETEILGDNATGKTTIQDAYNWLLYGQNSEDKTDFAIKTLDENNDPIPKLEHEVEGIFDVDGTEIVFKRLYTEKWVTKRGNDFEELQGHKTDYFIDGVPSSKIEYENKVSELIERSIAKIISSPTYFNAKIDWKERRSILTAMAGEISNEMIFNETGEINSVVKLINDNKSLEGEKKRLAAERLRLKKEIKQIPSRIDEVDRMKPEVKDWAELKKSVESIEQTIKEIDAQILDKNKALDSQRENISKLKTEQFKLQEQWNDLDRINKSSVNVIDPELAKRELHLKAENHKLSLNKQNTQSEITSLTNQIKGLADANATLTTQWQSKKAEIFPEQSTSCPTCKREYNNASGKVEQAKVNFNKEKVDALEKIEEDGKANTQKIVDFKADKAARQIEFDGVRKTYDANESELNDIETEKNKPKEEPKPTAEMISIQGQIDKIIIPEITPIDVSELTQLKKENQDSIEAAKKELAAKEQLEQADKRIEELKQQQRELSQELATIEQSDMEIDKFQNAHIDLVEARTNELFSIAKFKMFKQNINGGQEATCVCVVDGVPYSDLNTAMQINVGLDIISAMQHYHGIFTPVFIDHAESVVSLHEMECQVIKLTVDDLDEELNIWDIPKPNDIERMMNQDWLKDWKEARTNLITGK